LDGEKKAKKKEKRSRCEEREQVKEKKEPCGKSSPEGRCEARKVREGGGKRVRRVRGRRVSFYGLL
jgi:hypothetical protein